MHCSDWQNSPESRGNLLDLCFSAYFKAALFLSGILGCPMTIDMQSTFTEAAELLALLPLKDLAQIDTHLC